MKNPFLSAWLSGANTVLGAARSLAASEMGRQRAQWWRAMAAPMTPPAAPRPPRRTRRRRTGKA